MRCIPADYFKPSVCSRAQSSLGKVSGAMSRNMQTSPCVLQSAMTGHEVAKRKQINEYRGC